MKKASRAKVTKNYSGVLAAPIQIAKAPMRQFGVEDKMPIARGVLTSMDEEHSAVAKYSAEVWKARQTKLPALYAHYSIKPDTPWADYHLAMCLAINHVRGFQTAARPGRKQKIGIDILLCAQVILWQKEHPGKTDEAACRALTKKSGDPLSPISWQTALRRYKARKKMAIGLFFEVPPDILRTWLP